LYDIADLGEDVVTPVRGTVAEGRLVVELGAMGVARVAVAARSMPAKVVKECILTDGKIRLVSERRYIDR
jgi:hypothetical protein